MIPDFTLERYHSIVLEKQVRMKTSEGDNYYEEDNRSNDVNGNDCNCSCWMWKQD